MASKAVAIRRRSPARVTYIGSRPRAKKQFTIPLLAVAGFTPLVFGSAGIVTLARNGSTVETIAMETAASLTGYHWGAGKWGWTWAKRGMLPIALGLVGHQVASKLGFNRMLARAGIPLIRL